jgi:hypothetical protein
MDGEGNHISETSSSEFSVETINHHLFLLTSKLESQKVIDRKDRCESFDTIYSKILNAIQSQLLLSEWGLTDEAIYEIAKYVEVYARKYSFELQQYQSQMNPKKQF